MEVNESFFVTISNMINEAITGYGDLLELYKEKKQALIKADKDMLTFIDEKIMEHVKVLQNINKSREIFCKKYDLNSVKLSALIDMSIQNYPEMQEKFEAQKIKINELANEIALVNNTNVELIEHSLKMSDKMLDIIVSATQTDNYDKHGRNTDMGGISSIVEDA